MDGHKITTRFVFCTIEDESSHVEVAKGGAEGIRADLEVSLKDEERRPVVSKRRR